MKHRSALLRASTLAGLVLIAGASTLAGQSGEPASHVPETMAAAADARVWPGDRIQLRVWREPEIEGAYGIDEFGNAVLPRLGIVHVTRWSVGELRDSLRAAYEEFLRTPAIEVTLLRRVAVHGEVRGPGLYWVDPTITLRELIALAGGVLETASNEVTVIRDGRQIEFTDARSASVFTAQLQSGDQVLVRRRSWASLNTPYLISTAITVFSIVSGILLAR